MDEEFVKLLDILPTHIKNIIHVMDAADKDNMVEIVMDLKRELEVRFQKHFQIFQDLFITAEDIEYVVNKLKTFGPDDRAGLDGTLHRISKIDSRSGDIVGLTLRIGKDLSKGIDLLGENIINKSLILLGAPGSSKTTKLRSIANYLSIELSKKVIVVDTSNEIGGEGDIPHKAIGRARRMQVPNGKTQAHIMIKAVENHNPDVIIIDEIGTEEEALAAVTIAQRGVQLIATAHGKILQDLMENRPLDALVGGMNKVTVSDETMILSGLKSKTQLNRVHEPPFDMLIEIVGYDEVRIYSDLAHAVDTILAGGTVQPEERRSDKNGKVITTFTESYQPLDGPRRQYKPEVQPPVEKAPQRGRTSQARRRR